MFSFKIFTPELLVQLSQRQAELDQVIYTNLRSRQKGQLDPVSLIPQIKLALLTEIAELANELKTFKFWKVNLVIDNDKAQQELIDCLHFYLSLANLYGYDFRNLLDLKSSFVEEKSINDLLLNLMIETSQLRTENPSSDNEINNRYFIKWIINLEQLSQKLQLTQSEIISTYQTKNMINHNRQEQKY